MFEAKPTESLVVHNAPAHKRTSSELQRNTDNRTGSTTTWRMRFKTAQYRYKQQNVPITAINQRLEGTSVNLILLNDGFH